MIAQRAEEEMTFNAPGVVQHVLVQLPHWRAQQIFWPLPATSCSLEEGREPSEEPGSALQ